MQLLQRSHAAGRRLDAPGTAKALRIAVPAHLRRCQWKMSGGAVRGVSIDAWDVSVGVGSANRGEAIDAQIAWTLHSSNSEFKNSFSVQNISSSSWASIVIFLPAAI